MLALADGGARAKGWPIVSNGTGTAGTQPSVEPRDAGGPLQAALGPDQAAGRSDRQRRDLRGRDRALPGCGDLPIERAAYHIAFAEGRRGACREYLINTAEHARSLGIHDPYLEELVDRVVRLREERVADIAEA